MLKYNHGEKSPFMICADLECLLEKMHSCQNNPEKSYTEKTKHIPSGYSLFTNCSFDETKNKLDCYKVEDCMERFCKGLRDHTLKIINFEEKEMIPLTDQENKSNEKQKVCYICKKEFSTDVNEKMHLNYTIKSEITVTKRNRRRKYKTSKEILVVFHNGSIYDYHFIINKVAKEFYGQLESVGENTEKYIIFLDSTKLKTVWIKITIFFKRRVSIIL